MKPLGNIALIGMPGAGKSTVGVVLAKLAAMEFVDTDLLIQQQEGRSLQTIVDTEGYQALRTIEERVILSLRCTGHVIATGGSAAYSSRAMEHLTWGGVVVYLDVPTETIRARAIDLATRGIAGPPGQSLDDLFRERGELYNRYAELTVACGRRRMEEIAAEIIEKVRSRA